jgi:Fe-S oxidoreductase/nitrate reductase gamma subunit
MDAQNFTREIYWSPSGGLNEILYRTTYLWLAVAILVFAYGFWSHLKLWFAGQPERCFDKPVLRFFLFFRNVVAQRRVLRARRQRDPQKSSIFAACLHGFIFYGFCTLFFATTIVALKDYHIVDLYHGWFYAFIKLSCQIGGLLLAVGLVMGVFRRSRKDQPFKHSLGYTFFYFFLFLLVVQGFLLQGFRLAFDHNAVDAKWAFVGLGFSLLFPKNMDPSTANNVYTSLWYFHMLTTMAFIATVPYTRAIHIFTACLNLYTQRLQPAVLLAKMDFENSQAEYFGARSLLDFTWKDLLSFDSCTECRRCTDICPANAVQKPLDPREIILKLKNSLTVESLFPTEDHKEKNFLYEGGMIRHNEIWSCTNCGACVNECPVGIDQLRTIMELRRYQTLSLGQVPSAAGKAIENIKQYNNPWGLPSAQRFQWAENLNLPLLTGDSPEVEYLYYVGCAGSYDMNNQKVVRCVIDILKHCQVSFAVMGKAEKCNGEPVKRLGDEYSFSEIARSNVEQLSQLKFKKILAHCPHCYNTLKNDYQEYGGYYQVYHHTQLLSELVATQKLVLPQKVNKTVTFHDPCFLGRHNGEYNAPRQLLEAIAGLRLFEMEASKETSSCCGMGGGNMWYESEGGGKIVDQRLQHVAQTGAKTLVTGCSYCLINFKSAFQNLQETKDLEILDIAQAVALAMPVAQTSPLEPQEKG